MENIKKDIKEQKPFNDYNVADYLKNGKFQEEIEKFKCEGSYKTGFENIDEHLSLHPGIHILAAEPGLGKTTLSLQMADYIARESKVIYFSFEMTALEMVSKSIARTTAEADLSTAVKAIDIRKGEDNAVVRAAIEKYTNTSAKNITMVEGLYSLQGNDIVSYIDDYINKEKTVPVVFLDYLQVIPPEVVTQSTKQAVDATLNMLKQLQMKHNMVMVVIASVNRNSYLTSFANDSLKESGNIEFSATTIMGLQYEIINKEEVFNSSGNINKKRELIEQAKQEVPRRIELVCTKSRTCSPFRCYFAYYSAYDYFIADTLF